jgi:hypothetical protein
VPSGIYLLVSLKQHAILTSVQMFKNSKETKGIDIEGIKRKRAVNKKLARLTGISKYLN